jgi:hypothetical protein
MRAGHAGCQFGRAGSPHRSVLSFGGTRISITMTTPLKYAVALVLAYLAAWTTSYTCVFLTRGDGLDFTHYFKYLALAWTFRAGELVSFIWVGSLITFLPLAVVAVFILLKYERHRKQTAEPAGSS